MRRDQSSDGSLLWLAKRLARPEGGALLLVGRGAQGVLTGMRGVLEHDGCPSEDAATRGARAVLADRFLRVCRVRLDEWAAHPGVTFQTVLGLELARTLPGVRLPEGPERLTGPGLAEALSRYGEGLVILGEGLDRFLATRRDAPATLRFLEQLAAAIGVYLVPLWVVVSARVTTVNPGKRYEVVEVD